MIKFFLRLTKTIFLLIFIVIAGGVIFLSTLDPNQYKPQIIKAIHDTTGFDATLTGDIKLNFLPSVNLMVKQLKISNNHTLLSNVPSLSIDLKLMPLLHQQLVVDRIKINDAEFNVVLNEDNTNNWAPNTKPKGDKTTNSPQDFSTMIDNLSAVTLSNIVFNHIKINIKQGKDKTILYPLNLTARDVNLNKRIQISLDADAKINSPDRKIITSLKLSGNARFNVEKLKQQAFQHAVKVDGQLSIPKFIYNKSHVENIDSQLHYNNGLARINLNRLDAYHGNAKGSMAINHGKQKIDTKLRLSKVDIGPLLYDLNGSKPIAGYFSSDLKFSAKGKTPKQKIANLNGRIVMKVDKGELHRIDVDEIIKSINAIAGKKRSIKKYFTMSLAELKKNKNFNKKSTQFDVMTATFNIKHGIAKTRTLKVSTKQFEITGDGKISLPQQKMKFDFELAMLHPRGAIKRSMSVLDGHIPFTVSGPIAKPKTHLKISYILAKIKNKLLNDQKSSLSRTVKSLRKELPGLNKLF